MFIYVLDYGLQNQYLQKIFLIYQLNSQKEINNYIILIQFVLQKLLLSQICKKILTYFNFYYSLKQLIYYLGNYLCSFWMPVIYSSKTIVITFMPIVGLYSQYSLIKGRKHIGSFSIDTCGVLILSNVLRIMFWFSKGFAINLFIQSFVVIGMSFALLALCIEVGYKKNNSLTDLTGQEEQGFWRWKSIAPFIIFTVFFAGFMALMTVVFVYFGLKIYGDVVGLAAIAIECCLGFPQLYNNQKTKSVQGLSIFMIITWFFGDFFKTIYFIVMLQPTQFIVGGAVQLSIDLMIIIQIMAFNKSYQILPQAKFSPLVKDQIHHQNPNNFLYVITQEDGI